MPLYEYQCQDCGQRFEALRSMSDADKPIRCECCQGINTRRQPSVFRAQSGGKVLAGMGGCDCGNCSGGTCGSCSCQHQHA